MIGAPPGGPVPSPIAPLLARYSAEAPARGSAGAAVLILLRAGRTDVETLLIERTVQPKDPASGQVGLPGGRVQSQDESLVNTALREVEEEVGLSPTDLARPPQFVAIRSARVFSLDVAVFAGELGPAGRSPIVASRGEVAHVFWLPRSALSHQRRVMVDSRAGAREVDAAVFDGHVIWGFTHRVLLDFFEGPAPGSPT